VRRLTVPPGLDLVHEDEALLVFHKPAGLLSVPGKGPENADCLSARAQALFPDARVVHRLDMATSGLVVMARGGDAQSRLSRSFAQRQVEKTYEAWVAGVPRHGGGEHWQDIRLPLVVDWPQRPRSKVDFATGKPSHTRWRWLGTDTLVCGAQAWVYSRVALEPVTGRSHQLRVHLMAIGHPILGDDLYAPEALAQATPRLMLHACRITLPHPLRGRPVTFEVPAPF
jgi:tRNA pseudouridine32 synthase/23S rRNA pseudouridine746 synthase